MKLPRVKKGYAEGSCGTGMEEKMKLIITKNYEEMSHTAAMHVLKYYGRYNPGKNV